jgi:hypothetical protein
VGQTKDKRTNRSRRLHIETMEARLCLAASLGWDGPGQGAAELTYYIGNTPSNVNRGEFEAAVESALDAWSDVADIEFTQTNVPNQRDSLDFSFASLDGRGGTLAQAYFPDDVNRSRIAGDVQFDTSETWETGNQSRSAFDLVLVAVHEIGHALGLQHSHDSSSVLKDSVSPRQQFSQLANSDVDAILTLYAAADPVDPAIPVNPPVVVVETPTVRPRVTPLPNVPTTNTSGNTSKPTEPGKKETNNTSHNVPENRTNTTKPRQIPWWQKRINRYRKVTRYVKKINFTFIHRPVVVRFSFSGNLWYR